MEQYLLSCFRRSKISTKKRLAIAISGPSNSGKTTLILKVISLLSDKMKIAVVKHDPKDKAIFDTKGKDSERFFLAGADTLVVSPTRTTVFKHVSSNFDEIVSQLDTFDLLIVEGLKEWNLPRISLFRENFDESYLSCSNAAALSEKLMQNDIISLIKLPLFRLDDTMEICDWILKNAKDIS